MEMLQEVLGSLGFNVHIALANFFNFLIIFFLLQKFLFKKVAKTLEERKRVIEEGVKKSKESETILLSAKNSAKEVLHTAEKKGNELLIASEKKATLLAETIKIAAENHAESVKKEAESIKEGAYEAGLLELSSNKEKLLAHMFEKTLGEFMTKERNNALISSFKK